MITVSADFNKIIGKIKPVHGFNNSARKTDYGPLLESFTALNPPFARLHDTGGTYGGSHYVDIPNVFPDFSADVNDENSYDFTLTDCYIKPLVENGIKVMYRLGVTIEHEPKKYNIFAPSDPQKWAEICVHIIKHYNEGWANGFCWNIQFWEIWNEPDLNQDDMWKGTPEQYFELYVTAAKTIKSACPDIKVGGPALAGYGHADFARGFLKKIREEAAPLDFFSWHLYRGEPKAFCEAISTVEGYLKEFDLENVTLICDEWNYNPVYGFALSNEDEVQERKKTAYFSSMTDEVGAAFCASILCTFQNSCNDIATYYDGQPTNLWCGIFDRYGVPTKSYYAFCAFNELYKLGNSVHTDCSEDGIYCVSAMDENKICILVSRYLSASDNMELILKNLPFENAAYSITRTDKFYNYAEAESGIVKDNRLELFLPENSFALITVYNR